VVNETVRLEILAGSASLESDSVLTGENGVAEFPVTVGPDAGPILVSASLPGSSLAPVRWNAAGTVLFDFTPGGPGPDAKKIIALPGITGAEASVEGDTAWLAVAFLGEESSIEVRIVNPDSLAAGAYTGTIALNAEGSDPVHVPVQLTVTEAADQGKSNAAKPKR
jgi:hypothetical protein